MQGLYNKGKDTFTTTETEFTEDTEVRKKTQLMHSKKSFITYSNLQCHNHNKQEHQMSTASMNGYINWDYNYEEQDQEVSEFNRNNNSLKEINLSSSYMHCRLQGSNMKQWKEKPTIGEQIFSAI